jgi:serine/threonine protein kinase
VLAKGACVILENRRVKWRVVIQDQHCFQDLVLGRELGRGAVGVVQEAFWKSGGLTVAVKKLTSDVDPLTLNEFRREIAVHSTIAHPNIVRIYGNIIDFLACFVLFRSLYKARGLSNIADWRVGNATAIDIDRLSFHCQNIKFYFFFFCVC